MIVEHEKSPLRLAHPRGGEVFAIVSTVDPSRPTIVIPPPFEGDTTKMLLLSLYLTNNGFNTVRFDLRNHIGRSTGDFVKFTVGGGVEDLRLVIDELKNGSLSQLGHRLGVAAASLTARIMFRYLAETQGLVEVACTLFGVVNLEDTITNVNPDVIPARFMNDSSYRMGTIKFHHHPLDIDHFAADAVPNDLLTLGGCRDDIAKMTSAMYLVVADRDRWVRYEDYERAFAVNPDIVRGKYHIPGAGHELFKNIKGAKQAMAIITRCFRGHFDDVSLEAPLVEPKITEFIRCATAERDDADAVVSSPLNLPGMGFDAERGGPRGDEA